MTSILFDESGVGNISHLSTELRRKTLELACRIDSTIYTHYTPWLCFRPLLTKTLSHHELCYRLYIQGQIITNKGHLQDIENFLEEHSELTLRNLVGSREDWRILIDSNSRKNMISELNSAIELLLKSCYFERIYSSLVDFIIPLKQPRARGWSCQYARGAIFIGFPSGYSRLNLALDLAHEMGHQALALLQSSDKVIASDWDTPVYSEVRRTNRPAFQSLHAATAIAFMVKFVKDLGTPDYVHPEFSYPLTVALDKAICSLRQSCQFTAVGELLLDEFKALIEK